LVDGRSDLALVLGICQPQRFVRIGEEAYLDEGAWNFLDRLEQVDRVHAGSNPIRVLEVALDLILDKRGQQFVIGMIRIEECLRTRPFRRWDAPASRSRFVPRAAADPLSYAG
jgi:hypothetical protein